MDKAGGGALKWLFLVVLLVGPVLVMRAFPVGGDQPDEEAERLRTSLLDLRAQLDTCGQFASEEEGSFRSYSSTVDSLKDRLEALESLHPDGVPVDSYPVYLDAFRRYDEEISGWDERAGAAQEAWQICRDLTIEHNRLADSLRVRMVELGLWREPGGDVP